MKTLSSRVEEARAQQRLHTELRQVEDRLDALLRSHLREARGAATTIMGRARSIWEEERHFDAKGWVRPLPGVERMFELPTRIGELIRNPDRTPEEDKELHESEKEYDALCEELGVLAAYCNPGQYTIRAIAWAVEEGAPSTPECKPDDWPPNHDWLHEPARWDSDFYVTQAIEPVFRGEDPLAERGFVEHLELAFAVLLCLDRDRSRFEWLLDLAEVEQDDRVVAGKTNSLRRLRWENCSPLRWWMISRNYSGEDKTHEKSDEWAMRCRSALDSDTLSLGNTVLDLIQGLAGEEKDQTSGGSRPVPSAVAGTGSRPSVSHARRRRSRAPAPERWIYLNDAQEEYGVPSSTLQGWVGLFSPEHWVKDEDSGQRRVLESKLREILKAKGRLAQ